VNVRTRYIARGARSLRLDEARTALYNWLLARQRGGTFVLQWTGSAPVPAVRDELCALGLEWDEELSGAVRSMRDYRRIVERLLHAGLAYRCFCTPPRMVCDGRCAGRVSPGSPARVRFRAHDDALQPRPVRPDPIGDLILLRRDGVPARHLIEIVTDHALGITHVIRSSEWLPHTAAQRRLHRALGWEPPEYIHLPLLATQRHERLYTFCERGYQPLALLNELARLGWMPRGRQSLLSREELIAGFDLDRLSRRPVALDRRRLDWFNHRVLRELDTSEFAHLVVLRWEAAYGHAHRAERTGLSPGEWQHILAGAIQDDLHNLAEVADRVRFAFEEAVVPDDDAARVLAQPYARPILSFFAGGIAAVEPFDATTLDAWISDLRLRFKRRLGIRSRDVMYVLRAALTGQTHGPCLVVVCQLLGPGRCVERARSALAHGGCDEQRSSGRLTRRVPGQTRQAL